MEKEIQIWEEGFAITGNTGTALLRGSYYAEDFDDAVKQLMFEKPELDIEWDRFGRGRHAVWGCELFDNEIDARKNFG